MAELTVGMMVDLVADLTAQPRAGNLVDGMAATWGCWQDDLTGAKRVDWKDAMMAAH
jgi:hypothetical protein